MASERGRNRLPTIAVVALLGLAVLPALSGAAGAAPIGSAAATPMAAWAFGGEAWSNGGISSGGVNLTWNASFGVVVLFNATNTSTTTVELQEQRTVGLSVKVSASNANGSFTYQLKALELDNAYANLSRDANVTLLNGTSVPAIGLLNGSVQSTGSLAESLVGFHGTSPYSSYLNVTGAARVAASFSPALGLLPLNVTPTMGPWSSTSTVNATSAWTIGYEWARHGSAGSTGNSSNLSGGWNGTGSVTLAGSLGAVVMFHDHVARTAVFLALTGPFGLRDGFVLVPVGFDFFGGAARPYASEMVGAVSISSESVFVTAGHLDVRSVGAAQISFGTSHIPLSTATASGATTAAASPALADPSATVTAQPESPSQAGAQAACLKTGCPAGSGPWSPADLGLIALVAAAAVGALVVLARRGRPGTPASAATNSTTGPAGANGTTSAVAPWSEGPESGPAGPGR